MCKNTGQTKPVLCYVDKPWAFFTTQDLADQWGDDWDDAPYEHNAEQPYRPYNDGEEWEITQIGYDADWLTEPWAGHLSSPYSVEMLNKGAVPWLADRYGKSGVEIYAGATVTEFIEKIHATGGTIFLPMDSQGGRVQTCNDQICPNDKRIHEVTESYLKSRLSPTQHIMAILGQLHEEGIGDEFYNDNALELGSELLPIISRIIAEEICNKQKVTENTPTIKLPTRRSIRK